MSTFARIVDGIALDCQEAPDSATLALRFNPEWLLRNPFTVVPDGTVHGAKDNGDGTFTNPIVPAPPVTPQVISASAFQDLCVTAFGGNSVGETRFGTITRAMAASADDLVFSVNQRFVKSITFDKIKSGQMFQVLVSKGIMTNNERNAILNSWPNS